MCWPLLSSAPWDPLHALPGPLLGLLVPLLALPGPHLGLLELVGFRLALLPFTHLPEKQS